MVSWIILASLLTAVVCGASTKSRVSFRSESLTTHVEAWGDDSVRVRVTLSNKGPIEVSPVQALLSDPPFSTQTPVWNDHSLTNGNLRVYASNRGLLRFFRVSDGKVLLEQTKQSLSPPSPTNTSAVPTGRGSLEFKGMRGGVYGFGEHRGSYRCFRECINTTLPIHKWDWDIQHSQDLRYLTTNSNAWVPFFQSSNGFGFLWNMASYGHVHVGSDALSFTSNATVQLDYFVTTTSASTPDTTPPYADLLKHYIAATGAPPILPYAYTGFWQSKNRYSSQRQVLEVAREYKRRGLPLSVIVIDYYHWDHFGDWRFSSNKACWRNPRKMVSELQRLGVKVAVSVWPDIETGSIHFRDMNAQGLLVRGADGLPLPSLDNTWTIDAFHQDARQYMFQALIDGYVSNGIDILWLDSTEPQGANIGKWYYKLDDGKLHRDAEVGMAWVLEYHRMAREGMMAHNVTDGAFLTRSAFAGSQRYGGILWSGDIESTFDELAVQVQTAQHVAMSGIYLWTTDIGGYSNGDPTDAVFRELIVRWFQFGAFCPIFRLHGQRGGPRDVDYGDYPPDSNKTCGSAGYNEVWKFGRKAYGIISELMQLRQDLRRYIYHHLRLSHEHGIPILRPMVFDFTDEECVHAPDQFMFGDSWLVSPVLYQGSKSQKVYLPKLPTGQRWLYYYRDNANGKAWPDGSWVTVPTPTRDAFPLFVRCFDSRPHFDFCQWHNGHHPTKAEAMVQQQISR